LGEHSAATAGEVATAMIELEPRLSGITSERSNTITDLLLSFLFVSLRLSLQPPLIAALSTIDVFTFMRADTHVYMLVGHDFGLQRGWRADI
jgi:hypothetical protein